MTLDELNSRILGQCLHDPFILTMPDGDQLSLALESVTEFAGSPRTEQFSAIFREASGRTVPQGLYALEHERLGRFELFLVPVQAESFLGMEAAFHRLRPKPAPAP